MYGDIVELFTSSAGSSNQPPLLHLHLPSYLPHRISPLYNANALFISGKFPPSESAGMIVTLYKGKGSKHEGGDYYDYCGFTIITAVSKIYATLLGLRLTAARLAVLAALPRGASCQTSARQTTSSCCSTRPTSTVLRRRPSKGTKQLLYTHLYSPAL